MRALCTAWRWVRSWVRSLGRSPGIEEARQRNRRAVEALDAALKEVLHR